MSPETRIQAADFATAAGELCLPYQVDKPGSLKDRITQAIAQGGPVVLDFRNVTLVTSTCLNTFLGPLYGEFPRDVIRARLRLENADPEITELIAHSVPAWVRYFENRQAAD